MSTEKNVTAQSTVKAAAANPYITSPVRCTLPITSKANMSRVHVISIDSYPNLNLKFYKQVATNVIIPEGSTIERKPCNPHVNHVLAALLGVNNRNEPIYKNIKVTFIPAISCYGTAWDPDIVKSLQAAIKIATENSALGINTIVSYPIGGSYNSKDKVQAMTVLANIPRTYFMMSSGNNNQADYCVLPTESIPAVFVIGATVNGSQLSTFGNIGDCVKFYLPGRYKSVVNNKIIWGTSYAEPIAANIFINMLLANPELSREQTYARVQALSKVMPAKTQAGSLINMNIFPTSTVCKTSASPSMLPQFTAKQVEEAPLDEDAWARDPIAVPYKR